MKARRRTDIDSLISPNIRRLRAYQAEDIPAAVKLDANESPYGFGATKEAVASIKTNRYPDPGAKVLRAALARGLGVPAGRILVGNGSDELIYYITMAFRGPVLYPVPTFSMYGIIARAIGRKTVEVPLDSSFDIDMQRTLDAIKRSKPGVVYLSSPNNPTGNLFSRERIMQVLEHSDGIVVVDEAYQPFSGRGSMARLTSSCDNLIVLRTLSKVGLAALRVGMLVASEPLAGIVNRVRLPFNLNSFSQSLAAGSVGGKKMQKYVADIVSERRRLMKGLSAIPGVRPYPSDANFILFGVADPSGTRAALLEGGVLVRDMSSLGALRVTVGTRKENDYFLRRLKKVCR